MMKIKYESKNDKSKKQNEQKDLSQVTKSKVVLSEGGVLVINVQREHQLKVKSGWLRVDNALDVKYYMTLLV